MLLIRLMTFVVVAALLLLDGVRIVSALIATNSRITAAIRLKVTCCTGGPRLPLKRPVHVHLSYIYTFATTAYIDQARCSLNKAARKRLQLSEMISSSMSQLLETALKMLAALLIAEVLDQAVHVLIVEPVGDQVQKSPSRISPPSWT